MPQITIQGRVVGDGHPAYLIADIAANHDGDLARAVALIHLAAEAGADAAKFQHFRAEQIVSGPGFAALGSQLAHQAAWKRSVVDVYRAASVPRDWTPVLAGECRKAGIDFFSAPYDPASADHLDPFVPAYKIGSGDITWHAHLRHVAAKGKPVLLATGASTLAEVDAAVACIRRVNPALLLMQCNTNYTASLENFHHVNLRVLSAYRTRFPDLPLGLSDHTPGHATALGSVALGACAIEKHFTDDTGREGPDHRFSMDPAAWREMTLRVRELEHSLGDGIKRIEPNERESAVVQRRAAYATRDLPAGTPVRASDFEMLRPAPAGSLTPHQFELAEGRKLKADLAGGACLMETGLE